MIRIRLDEEQKRIALSVNCKINDKLEKELNLNRVYDETLSSTFERLYANYLKHSSNGKSKKLKKENETDSTKEDVPLFLYDIEKKLVPLETKNIDAWKQDYIFKIKEQEFKVFVNLPAVKKIAIPKILIAGMPALVKIEFESDETNQDVMNKNSLFKWYTSDKVYEPVELIDLENDKKTKKPEINMNEINWNLIEEGISKKFIILNGNTENKLVKVECYPRDGKREGLAVEAITSSPVLKSINKENMPMTERHKYTQNRLDSDSIRVVTYNILANCYSDTSLAKTDLYPYCPLEFLDFKYRKILLINEIINYNADIIFLQECESDFLEGELRHAMPEYATKFKGKGERTKEGEAILFRTDRFKFIRSHDIMLSQELQSNSIFERLWLNIHKEKEKKDFIASRGTVLQVIQLESLEDPNQHFLLANTHLFFHPEADFIRLIQSIISIKYLEKLKNEIMKNNPDIKKLGILFAGDFNSDPPSQAFQYIFTQQIPLDLMKNEDKQFVQNCDGDLIHSLNLGVYADFPFTNCIGAFEGILDYVFYESNNFELIKVVPLPTVEKVKEFVALPNKYVPSDHLALIFEFKIK